MIQFFEILNIILPVFLVIGLGFGLKRNGLVNAEFLFQLNKILYFVALPLLLFYKIAAADFSVSFNFRQVLALLLTTCLGFVLSYGFAELRKYPPAVKGTFSQACFRGNMAYMGLAIVFNAYGEQGLASGGVLLGFIVVALNFFSILALLLPFRHQSQKQSIITLIIRQVLANPLIIACFLGIGWSFFDLPIPLVFDKGFHIVTGMALPLALISIGATFSPRKIKGDLGKAMLATLFKLVLIPLLAASIMLLLGVYGQDLAIGIIFAGTPTATAAYIMAQQMNGDEELSGTIIMLSTLLSAFTFTASLFILKVAGL